MSSIVHITFEAEGRGIVEADCEVTYNFHAKPSRKPGILQHSGWYEFTDFAFDDVSITLGDDTSLEDFMPEDLVEQAEEAAEAQFLKDMGVEG